jgi:hypothetical protein
VYDGGVEKGDNHGNYFPFCNLDRDADRFQRGCKTQTQRVPETQELVILSSFSSSPPYGLLGRLPAIMAGSFVNQTDTIS